MKLIRRKQTPTPFEQGLGVVSKVVRALAAVRVARTAFKGYKLVRRLPLLIGLAGAAALARKLLAGKKGKPESDAWSAPAPKPAAAPEPAAAAPKPAAAKPKPAASKPKPAASKPTAVPDAAAPPSPEDSPEAAAVATAVPVPGGEETVPEVQEADVPAPPAAAGPSDGAPRDGGKGDDPDDAELKP